MASSGHMFDLPRSLLLEKINQGAQEARYRYQLDCAEMEEEFLEDQGPAQRKIVELQTEILKAFSIPPPVSVVFCNDDTLEILYPKLRLVQLEKFGIFWRVFDRRETGRTICFDVELPRQLYMIFPIILE
jgi:hypothetical protein